MESLDPTALATLLRKEDYASVRALHAKGATTELHGYLKTLGVTKMGARAKVIAVLGKMQADDAAAAEEKLKQDRHDPWKSGKEAPSAEVEDIVTEGAMFKRGDRVTIDGLSSRPDLNGKGGRITGFSQEKGRYGVLIDGSEGEAPMLLKPGNLTEAKPVAKQPEAPPLLPPGCPPSMVGQKVKRRLA